MKGKVYLVGAGSGDAELLTLKAVRLLREADIVLHDDLVSAEVLRLAGAHTRVESVGKRCGAQRNVALSQTAINAQLVHLAAAGYTVVRLKGGDPSLFGRAGEEIDALRAANIDYECVPGVTAATAAACAAGISLSDRRSAPAVLFMSGHRCLGKQVKWAAVIATGATVVVYMPGSNYSRLSRELITAGASAGLPCLVVSNATRAEQQAVSATVGTLSDIAPLTAPSLLIIGEVAGKAHSDIGRAEQSATQVRLEGDRMVWVD